MTICRHAVGIVLVPGVEPAVVERLRGGGVDGGAAVVVVMASNLTLVVSDVCRRPHQSRPDPRPHPRRDRAQPCRARLRGASVSRLAAAAGLKTGSLYFHFASKDALIGAVLREGVARDRGPRARAAGRARPRRPGRGPPAQPRSRRTSSCCTSWATTRSPSRAIVDDVPPAVRARHRRRNRGYGELWLQLLADARAGGVIADVDPRITRRLLYAAMNGAARARGVPRRESSRGGSSR